MKKMTITLNVTDEDIANGRRGNHHLCPIALSAERLDLFNQPVEASVHDDHIVLYPKNPSAVKGKLKGMRGQLGWRFLLSEEGLEFMSRYDSRYKVKPIKLIAVYEP